MPHSAALVSGLLGYKVDQLGFTLRTDMGALVSPLVQSAHRVKFILDKDIHVSALPQYQPSDQTGESPKLKLSCRSHIVIPARLASSRLSEKLLLRETGKSVLHHTHDAARQATHPLGVTVAVDCEKLATEVRSFGGECVLTDPQLPSGTDRVVVAAKQLSGVEVVVNVQGDEPEIDGAAIDQVIELLQSDPSADVATLATPIREKAKVFDPACVKVVRGQDGAALYFSRSPIPYPRDWDDACLQAETPIYLQHIGLYAYRYDFLMSLHELAASPLEEAEKLEQLRFLQAGKRILVGTVPDSPKGIDTIDDYRAFVDRYNTNSGESSQQTLPLAGESEP